MRSWPWIWSGFDIGAGVLIACLLVSIGASVLFDALSAGIKKMDRAVKILSGVTKKEGEA